MDNYRKIYETAIGCKVKRGYEVHHLDCNRENNSIENLVAIPAPLHRKYHNVRHKLIDFLDCLDKHRYFDRIILRKNVIDEYVLLRNEIYHYEAERDWLVYDNNPNCIIYSGNGCSNLGLNFKKI
jgi:hypothetical protein